MKQGELQISSPKCVVKDIANFFKMGFKLVYLVTQLLLQVLQIKSTWIVME
jgi:hypothetical protein